MRQQLLLLEAVLQTVLFFWSAYQITQLWALGLLDSDRWELLSGGCMALVGVQLLGSIIHRHQGRFWLWYLVLMSTCMVLLGGAIWVVSTTRESSQSLGFVFLAAGIGGFGGLILMLVNWIYTWIMAFSAQQQAKDEVIESDILDDSSI